MHATIPPFLPRTFRLIALVVPLAATGLVRGDDATIRPPATGERILFLGDSITQQGAGPGGYVTLVGEAIAAALPDAGVEVIGAGISGNKVPDLERRLDRDVLAKKPTTVVVFIGINDVWHSLRGEGTDKDTYERGLRSLLERIRAAGARVILCTPSVIGEKPAGTNPLDRLLDEYAGITRAVAADSKAGLVDLRRAFIGHLAAEKQDDTDRGVLTTDGVHLNAAGNRFVAGRMLEALGIAADGPPRGRLLRHVVLFKFKDGSTPADVDRIIAAFRGLPARIPQIEAFEWGTDVSPEGKSQGLTHCFLLTFASEAARDAYLPHPAHQEFVSIVKPHVDKVCVVDYWSEP